MRVYLSEALQALDVTFSAPRAGDAGYDLYALDTLDLEPSAQALIGTGVHLEIPAGYVGLVKDRSSMALAGLQTLGGVIDSNYRGEVKIILRNIGSETYAVRPGKKIAQLVVLPCYTEALSPVASLDELEASVRGADGFGSSGE